MKRTSMFRVLAVVVLTAIAVPVTASSSTAATSRLAGANRYDTAVEVSRHAFPNGANAVIVASGENFADALSASPAAVTVDGPVLVTPACCELPPNVAGEISRLRPTRIYVIGGEAAVSSATERQLAQLAPVTRVAGVDRYATALAVSRQFFSTATDLFIASGFQFEDVLAVGGYAAATRSPILLWSTNGTANDVLAEEVLRLRPATVHGTTANPAIEQAIASVGAKLGLGQIEDHSTISARYARAGDLRGALSGSTVYVVTSEQYPDGLAAGAAAGKKRAPLVLVSGDCVNKFVRQLVRDMRISDVIVVGGSASVSEGAGSLQPCPGVPMNPPTAKEVEEAAAEDLLDRINEERGERGLSEVEWHATLGDLAQDWSDTMAETGVYQHRDDFSPIYDGDEIAMVSENIHHIVHFVEDQVREAHEGWMRSDGHRSNLLNPTWNSVGIGVRCDETGGMWLTQNFGSTPDFEPDIDEDFDFSPDVNPIVALDPSGIRCPWGFEL